MRPQGVRFAVAAGVGDAAEKGVEIVAAVGQGIGVAGGDRPIAVKGPGRAAAGDARPSGAGGRGIAASADAGDKRRLLRGYQERPHFSPSGEGFYPQLERIQEVA